MAVIVVSGLLHQITNGECLWFQKFEEKIPAAATLPPPYSAQDVIDSLKVKRQYDCK